MRIAYVGMFRFPTGDVGAFHVLGIAKALRQSGHEVVFFGREQPTGERGQKDSHIFEYDGFEYVPRCVAGRRLAFAADLVGVDHLRRIKTYRQQIDAVIIFGGFSLALYRLIRFCRSMGITTLVDAVDYLNAEHMPLGRWGPVRWDYDLRLCYLQRAAGNVICISRWLEQFYRTRGCAVIRIPPLVDTSSETYLQPVPCRAQREMRFVYAGSPGRKDLLGNVLRAMVLLRSAGVPASMTLIGVSRSALVQCLGDDVSAIRVLGDNLSVLPRMSSTLVPTALMQGDFLPLLRPNMRYAEAGFPTKIVEALASSLPVIANITSDLGDYLKDGVNAFICHDETTAAFVDAARRAWMARDRWMAMRRAARQTAVDCFDFRVHSPMLAEFVEMAHRATRR